jgi:hypothetical protein
MSPKIRDQILNAAQELINGNRAKDYGDAYINHNRIADGWNIIMASALKTHGYLTAAHVALMMDWMKTSRLLETLDHTDSWIDKAGYTALGAEFVALEKNVPIETLMQEMQLHGKLTDGDVPSEE